MPCTASPNSFHTASGANPCGDAARAPHGERIRRRRGAGKSKGHPRAPTAPGAGCQCSILAGGRSCCREPEQRAAPGMLSSTRTTLRVQPGTGTGLRGEGHAGAPPVRQPRGAPQKAVLKHAAVSPPPLSALTCLVATSERFRRVQRQFCTSLGLELVRCLPKACMPPARETRHRAGYKYPDMQSVPSGEEKGAAAALSARRGRAGCLPTAASDARRRLVA